MPSAWDRWPASDGPSRDIAVMAARSDGNAPAATAPSMAAPSTTGSSVAGRTTDIPVASATICRTSALRLAPPLTTIVRQGMPLAPHGIDDIGEPEGDPAKPRHEDPLQAFEAPVEIEAGNDGARIGIGVGRTITEKSAARGDRAQACGFAHGEKRATTRFSSRSSSVMPAAFAAAASSGYAGCDLRDGDPALPPITDLVQREAGSHRGEKGPQTPGTKHGVSVVAMMQAEVPMT